MKPPMMAGMPTVLIWLYVTASAAGQSPSADRVADVLPRGARIIETANVPILAGKARELVLWMDNPQRVQSTWDTGPDLFYGDHWLGPTFLSLIDPPGARLINTIPIHSNGEQSGAGDGFALPFLTDDYGPYYVPDPGKDHKGKPLLLHQQDLTGEGVPSQFVLFDYIASGIAAGSVLGYSPKSDTIVQYPVESTQNQFDPVMKLWAAQVFNTAPLRPGVWKFTWEAGHGEEQWIDEEVHFDAARQLFIEKMTTRQYPGTARVHCVADKKSIREFLEGIRQVAPEGVDAQWLQSSIDRSAPSDIHPMGAVPIFNGSQRSFFLEFQVSTTGAIGIDLATDSDLAAALRAELKTWCAAN